MGTDPRAAFGHQPVMGRGHQPRILRALVVGHVRQSVEVEDTARMQLGRRTILKKRGVWIDQRASDKVETLRAEHAQVQQRTLKDRRHASLRIWRCQVAEAIACYPE